MSLEIVLLTLQVMINVDCLCTFVSVARTPDDLDLVNADKPEELTNLLAPPRYVLCVWLPLLICFNFSVALGPKSTVGSFISRYSAPASREPLLLGLALCAASISVVVWESLMMFQMRRLATVAMVAVWCASLPFYLILSRRYRAPNTIFDVVIFTLGELSVRLYFTWLTGAVIFSILDAAQYLYGDFFSYAVYAPLMGGVLALALGAYIQGRDPFVALMATWFVVGLAHRKCTLEGDAKATFEKLQTAATVLKPVFLLVLIIDAVRSLRHFLENLVRSSRASTRNNEPEITVYGTV